MDANRPLLVTFIGGGAGSWSVERMTTISGESLPSVERVEVVEGSDRLGHGTWALRGTIEGDHYVLDAERHALEARQSRLGRPTATSAAMIPIRKRAEWWALPHDERRAIFEERSHHIASTLAYLPRIARVCTMAGTSASTSTSLRGSSSLPRTVPHSTNWSVCCARQRSGPTSSARSTSG